MNFLSAGWDPVKQRREGLFRGSRLSSLKSILCSVSTSDLRSKSLLSQEWGRLPLVIGRREKEMTHPCGQGGEEVHRQQQRHHQLDHHGHHEGGDDDGDGRTSCHGFGTSEFGGWSSFWDWEPALPQCPLCFWALSPPVKVGLKEAPSWTHWPAAQKEAQLC